MTTRVLSVGRKVVGILFVVLVAAGTGLRPQPAGATNPIVGCGPAESSGMPLCSGHRGTTGGAEVGQSTRLMVWWADAAPGDAAGYAYDVRSQKDVSHSPADQTVPQRRYVMRAKQRDDLAVRSKGATVPGHDAWILFRVSRQFVATKPGALAKAGCSFTPETLVLMADGSTKPISQVEVGDVVLAVDPETGERGPRKVTRLWEHEDNELMLVTVDGKTLKITPNHPLWVVNRAEWVAAGDLAVGDLLLDDDGTTVQISAVQRVLRPGVDVHNLTVDDIHTFFVVVGGSSLLVHNTGPLCGLADDYVDVTAKGSRVRNVQTGVSRSSFEQNLIDAGYKPTVVGSNKNVVSYELNGKRYVVRDAATSTGGPTADFYPAGSSSFTLKIRLGG
jgi:hypothetical protein